jgi:hypothetical protein
VVEAMSKTYAIADLHGRFDLLEMALAKIADHAELPATLVTVFDDLPTVGAAIDVVAEHCL